MLVKERNRVRISPQLTINKKKHMRKKNDEKKRDRLKKIK